MGDPNFPFMHLLGIRVVEEVDGKSVIEVEVKEQHLQSMGWTHGGVYASLADCGMYSALAGKERQRFVTVSLTVNMMGSSKLGDVLTCTSETLHKGRSTAVARCIIMEPSGRQVAAAQATFMIVRDRDDSQGLSQ